MTDKYIHKPKDRGDGFTFGVFSSPGTPRYVGDTYSSFTVPSPTENPRIP